MGNPYYRHKAGRRGTLYLYRVTYRDQDPGSPIFTWDCWAYSAAHAVERFGESGDGFVWEAVARVTA